MKLLYFFTMLWLWKLKLNHWNYFNLIALDCMLYFGITFAFFRNSTLKQNITHTGKLSIEGKMSCRKKNTHQHCFNIRLVLKRHRTINLRVSATNNNRKIWTKQNISNAAYPKPLLLDRQHRQRAIADMRARSKREHEIDVVIGNRGDGSSSSCSWILYADMWNQILYKWLRAKVESTLM